MIVHSETSQWKLEIGYISLIKKNPFATFPFPHYYMQARENVKLKRNRLNFTIPIFSTLKDTDFTYESNISSLHLRPILNYLVRLDFVRQS